MRGILKKIIYRGCLKDLCFYGLGLLMFMLPILGKFLVDYIFYKLGV